MNGSVPEPHASKVMTAGLGIILLVAAILFGYGMTADLPYTRLGIEQLHIQLAVKSGTGDLNPHFFIHPPLLSYLLFGLYGATFLVGRVLGLIPSMAAFEQLYFTDPSLFYIIARVFILLAALGSVALFYGVARRLYGAPVALMATALMAVSPELVRWAHYAVPTVLMSCLFMAAFYFVTRMLYGGAWRDYLAAGLLTGLAIAARYDAALLVLPLVSAHALAPRRPSPSGWWADRRLLVALVCVGLGFLAGALYTVLDWRQFLKDWNFLYRTVAYGELTAPGSRITKPGWLYIVLDVLPFGWSLPLTLLGLAGVFHALWRRRREDLVLLSFIVVALVSMSRWTLINSRYFVQVVPFMLLLGVDWAVGLTARWRSARWRNRIVAVGMAAFLLVPLAKSAAFDRKVAQLPLTHQVKAWIEATIPSGTAIATTADLPLIPNAQALQRQLEENERKHLGRNVRLQRLRQHLAQFPITYDLIQLPFPSMGAYDDSDYDFEAHVAKGVRFFILDAVVEEYRTEPGTFAVQQRYIEQVQRHCQLIKEFRGPWVDVVPPMIASGEYVQIYELVDPSRVAQAAGTHQPHGLAQSGNSLSNPR